MSDVYILPPLEPLAYKIQVHGYGGGYTRSSIGDGFGHGVWWVRSNEDTGGGYGAGETWSLGTHMRMTAGDGLSPWEPYCD